MYGPNPIEDRAVPDKRLVVPVGSTHTLTLGQRDVFVSASSASDPTVISLPNVSEARGYEFRIHAQSVAASSSFKIKFTDGTASANSTTVSTTDVVVDFYSNGREWVSRRVAV